MKNRVIASILIICLAISLSVGCAGKSSKADKKEKAEKEAEEDLEEYEQDYASLEFDSSKWNYDKKNNVYWQISVSYCTTPEAKEYESMGIYVPGKYFDGKKNDDGTYTCTVNTEGKVKDYTAETAPIVLPVNTDGYTAQTVPAQYSYKEISKYLKAGFIYVCAGMRGKENKDTYSGGAPWGVTDLKAAVRYYRYNQDMLPGDDEQIYCFGMGEGGAQAAILGASGDSDLYTPYLTEIGAAMHDKEGNAISDAITGTMAWCPVTSLDYANEAYEWNMGQYSDTDTRAKGTWTKKFSEDMANSFADYINALGLKDSQGDKLSLKKSKDGIYTKGTYYDYLVSVVEESLNTFLANTKFPYTVKEAENSEDSDFGLGETGASYEKAEDYISYLNNEEEWVTYDAKTNTASITSMEAFVKHCKPAVKAVGAFDGLNRSQAENDLFGTKETEALHFDSTMNYLLQEYSFDYSRLENWDSAIADAYNADLEAKDSLGNSLDVRISMYNPMYYISPYYEGYGTASLAKYWRINSGIEQRDTALTVETNLALALGEAEGVEDVRFETVWGQGHIMAESSGNSTKNFICWVNECVGIEMEN